MVKAPTGNPVRPTRTKRQGSTTGRTRVTTAIVLRERTLSVFQRVAALRGSQGLTEASERGFQRPYSVSALMREILEEAQPALERELKKAGIILPAAEEES